MRKWLLLATIVFSGIGIFGVVQNNTEAFTQRSAILAADKAGQDTAAARTKLSNFVAAHMGSSLTFALNDAYNRDLKTAQAAAAATSVSGAVYAQAQAACGGKSDSITQAKCVTTYVSAHAQPGENPQPVAMPVASAYQYRYTAPAWTPDLSGLNLALAGLALLGLLGVSLLRLRRRH